MRNIFFSRKGQATTETVLLFPIMVIFIVFIIKIFGVMVLAQKMEIAAFYAARRYQLQSHTTAYLQRWDRRYLQKDIKKKVEDYVGFNNPAMVRFLSLRSLDLKISQPDDEIWTHVTLTAKTAPPRINFLCRYDKMKVCEDNADCLTGYNFLCETGGEIQVIKYIGPNERVLPYIRPEGK
ncbi:MAG: hypothetical protein IKJ44_06540 [Elusimicrobiaceae bacterium]|nr:hypothetical protein [Elusimicrobiaceae bacterium]MBR3899910.1 hypothetical protein [Elusimicrobiaceae bacterium]